MTSTVVKSSGRNVMRKLALAVAFTLETIGFAFAQTPATEDHSAHHPAQDSATSSQTSPAGGTTSGMQGMMQMMQGMQGMMRMMHQQAQSDQKQTARAPAPAMQDCLMMSRGAGTTTDSATTQAMMQIMQGMMQMMQSQMQSGQMQHGTR
jgi:hypothetical protein